MTGDFIKVTCPDCEYEQIVFNRPATDIECSICGLLLAEPAGGKAYFFVDDLEPLNE